MFHIHIYFTSVQKEAALSLRQDIATVFPDIRLGRVHDTPVGPHPVGSYELDVPSDMFGKVKIFLQEHKSGLTMMIHPVTGNDIDDHRAENISWIGTPVAINRSFFEPHRRRG